MKTSAFVTAFLTLGLSLSASAGTKEVEALKAHARTAEATANLKYAFTAQKAYSQEKDQFEERINVLGFSPERGNRYSYYFTPAGEYQDRSRTSLDLLSPAAERHTIVAVDLFKYPKARYYPTVKETGCPVTLGRLADGRTYDVGVTGTGEDQGFIVLAAGNIDGDPELDCWSIAATQRTAADGTIIPPGEPYHEKSDYNEELIRPSIAAYSDVHRLVWAARLWASDHERVPSSVEELIAMVNVTPRRPKPLTRKDPWGNPYVLIRAREHNTSAVQIIIASAGADKVMGTPDDIAESMSIKDWDD